MAECDFFLRAKGTGRSHEDDAMKYTHNESGGEDERCQKKCFIYLLKYSFVRLFISVVCQDQISDEVSFATHSFIVF